jgi:hypothetical protein
MPDVLAGCPLSGAKAEWRNIRLMTLPPKCPFWHAARLNKVGLCRRAEGGSDPNASDNQRESKNMKSR